MHSALIERLVELRRETGIVILALDYASSEDSQTRRAASETAAFYGFLSSVSEITLQTLPPRE
jgi:hypothetical protein